MVVFAIQCCVQVAVLRRDGRQDTRGRRDRSQQRQEQEGSHVESTHQRQAWMEVQHLQCVPVNCPASAMFPCYTVDTRRCDVGTQ